jgi:histidinol-phosphate aminotransferase
VLAERHGIRERNVLVAGGSTDLIRLAAAAYIGPGDRVLIPKPSYGDYEVACRLAGAAIINRPVAKGKNLRVEKGQIVACVRRYWPRALFLCNPNNPTGRYLERDEVEEILAELPETLVVLDEAYVAFVESAWESVKLIKNRNLLIIRSMTKDYALAGLRLGYAMSHERIIRALGKVQPPWSVNAFAQAAGLAAIESDGRTARCRRKLAEIKQYLAEELESLGLETVPSAANYFMVRVDSGAKWRSKLLARGILVRDCASFGLPQYIRLGVRTLPECRKLVETIRESGLAGR